MIEEDLEHVMGIWLCLYRIPCLTLNRRQSLVGSPIELILMIIEVVVRAS